jgi:hypothetical protein
MSTVEDYLSIFALLCFLRTLVSPHRVSQADKLYRLPPMAYSTFLLLRKKKPHGSDFGGTHGCSDQTQE